MYLYNLNTYQMMKGDVSAEKVISQCSISHWFMTNMFYDKA